jgi:hypothetical protein
MSLIETEVMDGAIFFRARERRAVSFAVMLPFTGMEMKPVLDAVPVNAPAPTPFRRKAPFSLETARKAFDAASVTRMLAPVIGSPDAAALIVPDNDPVGDGAVTRRVADLVVVPP